jgi:acyl carrier protein
MESLLDRVRLLVSDVFAIPTEQVREETTQRDVKNWDSTNILHLILSLESEFGVSLDVDEATELTSVAAILNVLKKKGVA